jgi:REP element-mobilizing transposase RayT
MENTIFQNRYRVPTARAIWHDYNGGMYYVTICTNWRNHYFGEIVNGKMILTGIGAYLNEQLQNIANHYPYAEMPLWVVMPNHLHCIVVIDHEKIPYEKRSVGGDGGIAGGDDGIVETFHETSLRTNETTHRMAETDQRTDNTTQRIGSIHIATQMQSWLSVVIRQLKQSVTRYALQNGIPSAWQPRFYDHIIRDTDEMNRIANYIQNNVAKWESDQLYGKIQ